MHRFSREEIFRLLILILFWGSGPAYSNGGQRGGIGDPVDTLTVKQLLETGDHLIDSSPDSAAAVLEQAISISAHLNYHYGVARGNQLAGIVYSDKGRYAEAAERYQRALEHYNRIGHLKGRGAVYNNLGNLYNFQGLLDEAVPFYLASAEDFEQAGEQERLSILYSNLGAVFEKLQQSDKSLLYHQKAIAIAGSRGDSIPLIHALINSGIALINLNREEESMEAYRQALQISRLLDHTRGIGLTCHNIGDHFEKTGQLDSAKFYYTAALTELIKLNDPYYTSSVYHALGLIHYKEGQYPVAKAYLERSREEAELIGEKETLAKVYLAMSTLHASSGRYRQSLEALQLHQAYADSLRSAETISRVNALETRYRTAEKDRQLANHQLALTLQEVDLRKKNAVIGFIAAGLLVVIVIGVLMRRNYRQEKKLHAQRMLTLRKQSEITALQAMVDGEEKERSRLARELHDGVGGTLSAAGMHIRSLEQQFGNIGKMASYRRALDMLDDASQELRKTAHNLMPEVLLGYGLQEAVSGFCKKFDRSGVKIDFQSYGTPQRYSREFELTVYRTVQELVHNVIKHAAASQILVQLSFFDAELTITVEDDGKGFDLAGLDPKKGAGLQNLRSRVTALDGTIDISSSPGAGTAVNIEFQTEKGKVHV